MKFKKAINWYSTGNWYSRHKWRKCHRVSRKSVCSQAIWLEKLKGTVKLKSSTYRFRWDERNNDDEKRERSEPHCARW